MATDEKKYLGLDGGDWYPKPRDASFECPICGSKDYHRVQVTARNGKRVDTESLHVAHYQNKYEAIPVEQSLQQILRKQSTTTRRSPWQTVSKC